MEEKNYKYDAFISYRHCDLDKFVAENLHKTLENYDLPKNVKEKLGITGRSIKRVFRDQDELPLSSNLEDPIIDALNNSKYLIVICSPRLKDSLWCKKEIETFKKIRGRENIFCVLIEGEPADSFPEELLHDKGKIIEPLAADVRGTSKKEVLKKIKEEVLRLVAPMYKLDYDDLKQRHKQREQRRRLTIIGSIAIFFILFSLYSSIMLIKISSQSKTLKLHQASSLSESSKKSLDNDSRYDAVKHAYESLTKFNGVKMPYTSDAEYALVDALGVYDSSTTYKAVSEIKTDGVVDFIKDSKTSKYALIYDESEVLSLWDTKTLKMISSYKDISSNSMDNYSFTFAGDDVFAYINKDGGINILNTKDGKLIKTIDREKNNSYMSIKGSMDGKYIVYVNRQELHVYSVEENKELGVYTTSEYFNDEMYFSEDYKYLFTVTEESFYQIDNETLTVRVIELENQKEINSLKVDAGYTSGMFTTGDNVYMLLNKSTGTEYCLVAVSYNYKENRVNWTYKQDDVWGKYLYKSLVDGINHVLLVHNNELDVLDENGNLLNRFNTKSEIMDIYGFTDEEVYLAFTTGGKVNYIDRVKGTNLQYDAKFTFNLERYSKVAKAEKGFLLVPYNENRVIYYAQNNNTRLKEIDKTYEEPKIKTLGTNEVKKLKEEYDVQNKNLISKMFYNDDKTLLFVYYINEELAIYNVKDKTLLNTITGIHDADAYYGKDVYGRIYVGDISYAYIIDKNYNKVGRVNKLCAIDKDKLIIKTNSKYYELKILTLDDLLKEAKEYLK